MRLYLWGYLNAVRSSRALERECGRNVECMWLLGRLALAVLDAEGRAIMADLERVHRTSNGTVVTTEPDARVMRSLHAAPGYNLQTAVETGSHMIVVHEVTNEATDNRQLQPMAEAASAVLASPCTVVADAGYANGAQIAALDAQGIVSDVAPNRAINNQGDGTLYDRSAFRYDAVADAFVCPQGMRLERKQASHRDQNVDLRRPR